MVTGPDFERVGEQPTGMTMSKERILSLDAYCLKEFHGYDEVEPLDLSRLPEGRRLGVALWRGQRGDPQRFCAGRQRPARTFRPNETRFCTERSGSNSSCRWPGGTPATC